MASINYQKMFDLTPDMMHTSVLIYQPSEDLSLQEEFKFDFALCAFIFFQEKSSHPLGEVLKRIQALARIAKEVRIFPLLASNGEIFPEVGPVLLALQQAQYGAEIREVIYPENHPNAMLRVWAEHCKLH